MRRSSGKSRLNGIIVNPPRVAAVLLIANHHGTDVGNGVGLCDSEADLFGGDRWLEPFDSLPSDGLTFGNHLPVAAARYVDGILENVLPVGNFFFEDNVSDLLAAQRAISRTPGLSHPWRLSVRARGLPKRRRTSAPNWARLLTAVSWIRPRLSGTSDWRKLAPARPICSTDPINSWGENTVWANVPQQLYASGTTQPSVQGAA